MITRDTMGVRRLGHFAVMLVARGALLLVLGVIGVLWPRDLLIFAMVAAAFMLAIFGVYEGVLAIWSRGTTRGWPIPLLDGLGYTSFAALSLYAPFIALRSALLLVALWLTLHAVATLGFALALWPMRRTRFALLGWTVGNVVLACVAAFDRRATIVTLLYTGAGYAAVLGVLHVATGLWVRHHALPRVQPTAQSQWAMVPPAR